MTPAQLKSAIQKAQRNDKRAVDDYNRKASRYNAAVDKAHRDQKRAIDNYNRELRSYNSKTRAHNQKVESQRRRLNQELQRQQSRSASATFSTVRTSTANFVRTYEAAEQSLTSKATTGPEQRFLDLTSDEAANSVYLINALDGDGSTDEDPSELELRSPSMTEELAALGEDLISRWTGALYALSPANPDAARHFCTSAREVIISMLDLQAPDATVTAEVPNCEMTDRNVPTRRAKLSYLLSRHGVGSGELADAVSGDVDNVLALFRTFNDGTHGHAGRFTITELTAIRTRVESAISFIYEVASIPRVA